MSTSSELRELQSKIRNQITHLQEEHDAIETTIKVIERQHFQSAPVHLEKNNGLGEFSSLGITDACRKGVSGDLVTPVQVRDRLIQGGYAGSQKKMLNSLHPTLRRLVKMGELEAGTIKGQMAFRKAEPKQKEGT